MIGRSVQGLRGQSAAMFALAGGAGPSCMVGEDGGDVGDPPETLGAGSSGGTIAAAASSPPHAPKTADAHALANVSASRPSAARPKFGQLLPNALGLARLPRLRPTQQDRRTIRPAPYSD